MIVCFLLRMRLASYIILIKKLKREVRATIVITKSKRANISTLETAKKGRKFSRESLAGTAAAAFVKTRIAAGRN